MTARFKDGDSKPGRGIWPLVWRVFKLELTMVAAAQRESRLLMREGSERKTYVELLDGGSATLVGGDHLHLHDLD